MDWTLQKEQLLEKYIIDYYQNLEDTRYFFKNLDWNSIYNLVGIDDQDFLRLKIDEIYDNYMTLFLGQDFNTNQLILHWKSKRNPIFQEVVQLIESLGLEEFKFDLPTQEDTAPDQPQTTPEYNPIPDSIQKVKSPPVPQLTKTERRASLELMHPRPTFGIRKEFKLSKAPIAATTNINVMAKSEAKTLVKNTTSPTVTKTKKKFSLKQQKSQPQVGLEQGMSRPKHRRTSTVDEQLPTYIRDQLTKHRPRQKLTPKPSRHQIPTILSNESSLKGSYKKPSRLQNLVTNSQFLYAHNKDLSTSTKSSPTNTFDSDQRIQFFSDESDNEDNKEYILPDLLTRYIGMHVEHEDEEEDDDEEEEATENDSQEEEEEEDHDFVNVGEEDDDDDYLFKI